MSVTGQSGSRVVVTTARLWVPAVTHWRSTPGGAAGSVMEAAIAALDESEYRWPLPTPAAAAIEALNAGGRRLNDAVRARYARGARAGAIRPAATAAAEAATMLGAGLASAGPVVLCRGRLDALVKVRGDARLLEAMRAASNLHGATLGGWLRDSVAAACGEHQVRVPDPQTVAGRLAVRRATAVLVQAAEVVSSRAERLAVEAAEDALRGAELRLRGCGRYRGRHTPPRRAPRPWEAA